MLLLPERTESPAMIGAWPVNSVQQVDALDLLRGVRKAKAPPSWGLYSVKS